MKHKRFKKAKDSEWVQPVMRNYLMECCDCGLVHRLNFRIVEGVRAGRKMRRVQFQAERARNYTAQQRRRRGASQIEGQKK